MKRSIILLGAPGSGKGTLAGKLKDTWHVAHISTGDMFREAVKNGTAMGKKASEYMNAGKLVPDDVTIGIVDERFSKDDVKKGYLLDGFPRTVKQAEALRDILKKNHLKIDAVVLLDLAEDIIIKRLTGRRTCSKCNAVYNVFGMPPKKENVCDKCSNTLIQREDDKEAVIKQRLLAYHDQTAPLIDFYKKEGLIINVDASVGADGMIKKAEELLR